MTMDKPFIGQDAAWQEWLAAIASERMHHAWLLSGGKGLGKRAFARAAAAELVRQPGHPMPDVETHPDIHILDHLPANDDEVKKKAEGKPYQTKRNITVDQVRGMIRRLAIKPTLGDRRAIVIDPADDMEKGAVNALLKALEEPPAGTYFLLVTHQPGRLLPTIRSRCRVLRFAALGPEQLDSVIRRDAPQADAAARAAAIAAAQGSPGVALDIVEHDLGGIHALMMRILQRGDPDFALRGALAEEMGGRPARDRQLAALELARAVLVQQLRDAPRRRQLGIIEAYGALTTLATQAPTYNFDAGLLIMEIGGLLASAAMPREAAR
ncbi:DNA polymerase III subunit delta' [Novosphingobium resinovorum]|uniref:DNA polymerase III subunit delta n=1 Tax=Novosphingobium resinovorum TaxID=158500 RepID=A0A031K2L2_9SPHN|nr:MULTISPECIES: DNA polymerase III subunit delta' [Novosphingobium]AOR76044.1 DNA polymerase III subunit delta' [Novosphingobium resinovorum]EZP83480.1 DNA polymerase III subunit delta [Novosphingobium resinovorum]MBF7011426.1 DNA polymerase III subunit delta' [Novosphingobium sp. HR1a]WJM29404.1 DNA polymerase III subunit delta' [Novosphingobium resinovorum]